VRAIGASAHDAPHGLQLHGEIPGLLDRRSAEIDHDLTVADIFQDAVGLENAAHMFGAG
jgi:hypothetical protein